MAITKIGTPELFDFSATNTSLQLPTGTTAQRPTSPSAGEWRFNTTEKYVEYWDGGSPGAWRQIDTEAPPNPDDFPSQNFNVNTYNGTGATQTIDAKFNEAANFNGSSSKVALSGSTSLTSRTISMWFNPSKSTNLTLLDNTQGKTNGVTQFGRWNMLFNYGGTNYAVWNEYNGSQYAMATFSYTFQVGTWYHVAFCVESGNNAVYINGVAQTLTVTRGTSIGAVNLADCTLGFDRDSSGLCFDGKIDQVRIFNTALTAAQAEDLYTDETTTTAATLDFPAGAGCIAAYQLDGDASDVGGTYGGVETDIGYTGLRFQPDFVWIKARSDSKNHVLVDSVRGNREVLEVDVAGAQVTSNVGSDVTGFNSNGFGLGPDHQVYVNPSGTSMVAWCLKAGGNSNTFNVDDTGYSTASAAGLDSGTINPSGASVNTKSGFSIIQYTTSGVQSIAHGLGKEPQLIIQRNISIASYWPTYVSSAASPSMGNGKLLRLNDAPSVATDSFFMSAVGSDTFTTSWSGTSYTYINYCFANIANYQKVGSYTGNSSTSNIISTEITAGDGGFEPAFVIIKAVNSGDNWYMLDNKRLNGGFPYTNVLYPNLPNAEAANVGGNGEYSMNFLTNGFELTEITAGYNQSGEEYFYLAIAADKDSSVPTQANSFSPTIYTGNGGTQNIYTSFAPDFTWIKGRTGAAESHVWNDTIRGKSNAIYSNTSGAQYFASGFYNTSFNPNGFTVGDNAAGNYGVNGNAINYVSWNWKAGGLPTINSDGTITSIVSANVAAGFSIVKYTGPASNATIAHGLGVTPSMIIQKPTGSGNWYVYFAPGVIDATSNYYYIILDGTGAKGTTSAAAPTTTTFNSAGSGEHIAYCFADITGHQKIGSYTGNAGSNPISVGFQPGFVMAKQTSGSGGSWLIMDSARGANEQLYPNLTSAEYSDTGNSFSSTGFTMKSNGNWNVSGETYIYLAIA